MVFKVGDAVVSTLTKENLGAGTVLSVTEDKAFVAFANRKNSMWCYNEFLKKYDDWEHDMNQVQQEIDSRVVGYDIPIADLSYDPPTFSGEDITKISSDGGPSDYYDFLPGWITLNDYIEYKSEQQWGADSFHLANITKAGCRWGDKEGTTKVYDAKKIVYSAIRILRRLEGTQNVRVFLKDLLESKQFT